MNPTQIQTNLRLTRQILDHALRVGDPIGIALAATAHSAARRIARIWGVTA